MASIITVFRSRLRDPVPDAYWDVAAAMQDLATEIDGFVERKVFVAEDGERLSLVEFADAESHATWRDHVAHREAQEHGRAEFYAAYDIAVCEVLRRRIWAAQP